MSHDFMRSGIPDESDIRYPLIHESMNRVQIVFREGLFGFALLDRTANRYTAYTLLTQAQAEELEPWRVHLGASYLAPAADPICWMYTARDGRLIIPASLSDSPGGDFWIGCHFGVGSDSHIDQGTMAVARLSRFVYDVRKVIQSNAHSTL